MTEVEVFDQHGGSIKAYKNLFGMVHVTIYDARNDTRTAVLLDPKNEEDLQWLKTVYQPIHLGILLKEEA